jgi:hypothetical protein
MSIANIPQTKQAEKESLLTKRQKSQIEWLLIILIVLF